MKTRHDTSMRERLKVCEPEMYDVVLLNDDFTPMDFVVDLLREIFRLDTTHAERLMLSVHHHGDAVVGTFTLDVAQSKVARSRSVARQSGHPLRLDIQPHP